MLFVYLFSFNVAKVLYGKGIGFGVGDN